MMEQMSRANEENNPKGRNNLMESARLKADIVCGLGADEDSPERQGKGLEAEPTRKYAVMKTTNEGTNN